MSSNDLSQTIAESVSQAFADGTPLRISAGGSKHFYGNEVAGEALDVSAHTGIIEYHPSELVITARSGTSLTEIEQALADNGQRLAFEPPIHTPASTLGGVIATGLSGPARGFCGAARDFVLGTRIINGKGEVLKFGGQVMKNVAGYDGSRLMVGAQGTLGVLLEISLKVLPLAEREVTLSFDKSEAEAAASLSGWIQQGQPITASAFHEGRLSVRLASTANDVAHSISKLGGEETDAGLWQQLRNQTHPFFEDASLWRVSLPVATPPLDFDEQLIEWGGSLRWIHTDRNLFDEGIPSANITRYPRDDRGCEFQPLATPIHALHRRLKDAFDPAGILNPGRLYKDL